MNYFTSLLKSAIATALSLSDFQTDGINQTLELVRKIVPKKTHIDANNIHTAVKNVNTYASKNPRSSAAKIDDSSVKSV